MSELYTKFLPLYHIYKSNIKSLYNSYYHKYVHCIGSGSMMKIDSYSREKYIADNFGSFFPIYKFSEEEEYSSINEFYGQNLVINDNRVLCLYIVDGVYPTLLTPYIENDKQSFSFFSIEGIRVVLHNSIDDAKTVVDIMMSIELKLIQLIKDNIDEFIDILCKRTGSKFYPYYLIDNKYSNVSKSIQFMNRDGKIKHFSCIPYELYKFDCENLYSQFIDVVEELMNHVEYKILNGNEEFDHLFKNDTKEKIWEDLNWTENDMVESMNDGMYLPMIYIKTSNGNTLTDGIHRFLCLRKMCKKGIKHKKGLALNLSCPNKFLYNKNINILIDIRLQDNNTWPDIMYPKNIKLSPTGKDFIVRIYDLNELIVYFYLLARELNNLIDDDLFKKFEIEPSDIINIE